MDDDADDMTDAFAWNAASDDTTGARSISKLTNDPSSECRKPNTSRGGHRSLKLGLDTGAAASPFRLPLDDEGDGGVRCDTVQ